MQRKKSLNPLEKRIPKNPKYAHVKSTLDTGMTVEKLHVITTKEFLKRRDELFRRIKCSTLAAVIEENTDYISGYYSNCKPEGERSVKEKNDSPYLLLDCRDAEEFERNHIRNSVHYPGMWIRSDRVLPILYKYKNRSGTFIVIYDNSGVESSKMATHLLEKGFDNVLVVHGGIDMFSNVAPDLIEGELPKVKPSKSKTPLASRDRPATNRSVTSYRNGSRAHYNLTSARLRKREESMYHTKNGARSRTNIDRCAHGIDNDNESVVSSASTMTQRIAYSKNKFI